MLVYKIERSWKKCVSILNRTLLEEKGESDGKKRKRSVADPKTETSMKNEIPEWNNFISLYKLNTYPILRATVAKKLT